MPTVPIPHGRLCQSELERLLQQEHAESRTAFFGAMTAVAEVTALENRGAGNELPLGAWGLAESLLWPPSGGGG